MSEEALARLAEVRRPFAKRSGEGDDQRENRARPDAPLFLWASR
jgi:hypothetical protein